ncbi:MAG: sugar phosphate nucleotidyltransferase [Desulfovibrionaceae bacterium]
MDVLFLISGNILYNKEDNFPLYLTEIEYELILEKQIKYTQKLAPSKLLFCIKIEDIITYKVDSIIAQLSHNNTIIPIQGKTQGAICTALLAAEHIDTEQELLIVGIDDLITESFDTIISYFRKQNSDVGLVSFSSVHPRYSFIRLDHTGIILECTEKQVISNHALASFYYFRKGKYFLECAQNVIRKDNPIRGHFYISQTINEMILQQKRVTAYRIDNKTFHPLKTEAQLALYIDTIRKGNNCI